MKKIITTLFFLFFTSQVFAQKKDSGNTGNLRLLSIGVVDEMHSGILNEKRILNIYFPEGYNKTDTLEYPVIYLLDGSIDEDFIHIAGLVQFNSFEWINQVPKSIVVGIATVDRRRDFTFPTTIAEDKKAYPTSGQSAKFISFLETELLPYLHQKYGASNSATLIGQSLGGLLATEILVKKPALFNRYIIVSPSLWWDNGSMLNTIRSMPLIAPTQKIDVYIGVGKEGLTPTKIPRVMEVDANVLADKLRTAGRGAVHVIFDYLPQENHATIMHQAVFNAFRLIFPKGAGK
jgi:predicted alpha/beta superfamily hydrolase